MIKVESILASRANNVTIHTLVCEFPLNILNQLLTHRAFSRNSSSARAVPVSKAVAQVEQNPAQYMWTAKNPGMTGPTITDEAKLHTLDAIHAKFQVDAMNAAELMDELGVHKQQAGRYLTPFQNCRIVLTSTDWANWDWLRNDEAAQPEIQALAKAIIAARDGAEVMELEEGEYHLPFLKRHRAINGELQYFLEDDDKFTELKLEDAIKVSMSACAQTSYRKLDLSMEKADNIIPKLFDGAKVHASPSEHQAMVPPKGSCNLLGTASQLTLAQVMKHLPNGFTGINIDGTLQSGNFTNWIQHRQLLDNHDGGTNEHRAVGLDELEVATKVQLEEAIESLAEALTEDTCQCDESEPAKKDLPTVEEFEKLSEEDQQQAITDVMHKIVDSLKGLAEDSKE